MKGPHEYTIQDVLKTVYRQTGLTEVVAENDAIDAYNAVVGEFIAKLTRKISLNKNVLHVQLSSAALRQELSMRKESVLEKINEIIASGSVKDIFFY